VHQLIFEDFQELGTWSASDGAPPYLMAVAENALHRQDVIEFLAGNTPTPILLRYCLPLDRIEKIAVDSLENGDRSTVVAREEI